MNSKIISRYDHADHFSPLMPTEMTLGPLLERASDLTRAATAWAQRPAIPPNPRLAACCACMNSYYSNRLEGEHIRPSDMARALKQDFPANADLARKQRLAVAHIHTEQFCEEHLSQRIREQGESGVRWLYSAETLMQLHLQLFQELPDEDLRLVDGFLMVPGELRTRQVAVGRHEAPTAEALPRYIERWATVYGQQRRGEASIVALAAAHHRLAWVHPSLDGNGRVARLHTHLLLHGWGLTKGVWSPLRGFARTEQQYKALLQAADEHRRGDLDGRGNLSQAALIDWVNYTLNVCIDQVEFMAKMLDIQGMRGCIEAALAFESSALKSGVRPEALNALHYLFTTQ